MNINGFEITKKSAPYIIAEMSGNHNGNLDIALDIVKKSAESGANALKVQTHTAEGITFNSKSKDFLIDDSKSLWNGQYLYDLYKSTELSKDWHKEIFNYSAQLGITCFSSPFDVESVSFLETLNAPAYKVASFESTDVLLLRAVAQTGKPVIVSTGMAALSDMDLIVNTLEKYGCKNYALLKCTSAYPADISDANLKAIPLMKEIFGCPIGVSDHTIGNLVPTLSVALGATIIEKHVCLDRSLGGVDSVFSMEPDELTSLVQDVKQTWQALGNGKIAPSENEKKSLQFRRSLYFVKDLIKGDIIDKESIKSIRPGFGLATKYYDDLIGTKVSKDIVAGTATSWNLINE